jgi:hypothetical protein
MFDSANAPVCPRLTNKLRLADDDRDGVSDDRPPRIVSKRPVVSFFGFTFLFSWPLFFAVLWVFPHSMALQGTFGSLAVFAPAFAAMLVGRILDPERILGGGRNRLVSFLVAWWTIWKNQSRTGLR